ncbi:hypothetical protein H3V53_37290 [Paraburkholderia bengalensis]|uniref:LysR substrate-binding domain-containing protein n=1 Tax=Paraburkholderia bengalensis TaxID=2747562 RepID=A0ABU8J4H0_9BURK
MPPCVRSAFHDFPADKSPSLHAKFLMACDEAGFSPRIAHEAWQMASMVSLVAAGMGVALLPAQDFCFRGTLTGGRPSSSSGGPAVSI